MRSPPSTRRRRRCRPCEGFTEQGVEVALVLADQSLPHMDGRTLLFEIGEIQPLAKRALLIRWGDWGDPDTAEAIHVGMARDDFDYYVMKPISRARRAVPPHGHRVPPRVVAQPCRRRTRDHPRRRALVAERLTTSAISSPATAFPTSSTTRPPRSAASLSGSTLRTAVGRRWRSCATRFPAARLSSSTLRRPSSPEPSASTPSSTTSANSTPSSSGPALPDLRPPSTRRRRGFAPSSSSAKRSGAKPAPAR